MAMMQPRTRLQALTESLKLDKTQEKATKAILDAAYKKAVPTREALAKAHAAIGASIAAGDDRGELDRLIAAYATLATGMGELEMTALADVLKPLPDTQRTAPGVDGAVALMRGAFVGKKWDAPPGEKGY